MSCIAAVIPARSGSKGVKDKNIKNLNGHCLLEWSINAAKNSELIDRVFLSTDSQKYADIGESLGAEVPFLRPSNISGDNASDFDFVHHAIKKFKRMNFNPDFLVHLRPTTPIRNPKTIDNAISFFANNTNFNSLRSVHKMSESSYKTLEIIDGKLTPLSLFEDLGRDIDTNAPRQIFPDTYQANGYVDVLSTQFIEENHQIHGSRILPFVTDNAYEIDSLEDFKYLEYLASNSPDIMNLLFS